MTADQMLRTALLNPALYANDWQTNSGSIGTSDGNVHQVVGADPRRVALLICDFGTQGFYLWINDQVSQTNGLSIVSQYAPSWIILTLAQHGSIVQQSWYALGIGFPADNIGYIESLWIPKGAG